MVVDLGILGCGILGGSYFFNFVFILSFILFHEFGHYWVAKRQGIYKKLGTWFGNPVVKLKRPFNNRFDYMSGFIFSYLSLPILYVVEHTWGMGEIKLGIFWSFTIIALGFSVGDIIIALFHSRRFNAPNWLAKFLIKIGVGKEIKK